MDLERQHTSNGIAYHRRGAGPAVVFLHGLGLRAECWSEQIAVFDDQYEVFALDLPGHGESAITQTTASTTATTTVKASLTDPIAEALDELGIRSAVIVGHSLGALIAVELSYYHVSLCAGVVPISVIFDRDPAALKAVQNRARELRTSPSDSARVTAPIARWFGTAPTGVNARMARRCRDWILRSDIDGYADAYYLFAHYPGFNRVRLEQVAMSMLFITGELDSNSTPAMSKALAERVTNGEAFVVEQSRHMLQLTHAAQVNQALLKFASRCTIR